MQTQAWDEEIQQMIELAKANQKEYFDAKQQRGLKTFTFAVGDQVSSPFCL